MSRRPAWSRAAAALMLAALAGLALRVTGAAAAPPLQAAQLDNGLQIHVYEDHSVPVISVLLAYRVGSRDEPVGKRGMAHLLEHMMFQGTSGTQPGEFARIIDRVGGMFNAFTMQDMVGYWTKVPSSQLELVFMLEADRMQNLVITPEKLDTEKQVVKEEYLLRLRDNPYGLAFDRLMGLALQGTPYAWTPAGFIDEIDQITADDLRDFYRRHYVPNNAVLVVAGDADLPTVLALAEKHFGRLPRGQVPARPRVQLPSGGGGPVEELLPFPVQLPAALAGYLVPGLTHPDRPALEVLAQVLSAGESSRLNQKLVREQGVALAAAALPILLHDAGLFLALAVHLPQVPGELVSGRLRAEVAAVAEAPPSSAELAKAANQLALGLALARDSLDGAAMAIAQAAIAGDLSLFTSGIDPYLAVTAEDVARVARTYLNPDRAAAIRLEPAQ